MSSRENDISPPPGFESPFAEIFPAGGWSSLGKRRGLRKKATQNFFGLTNSRLSPRPHDQGLRRGRGRPPKKRSDVPSMKTESSASQPLRRGRGRPRKERSDVPSMTATESSASQPLRRGRGRPRKKISDVPTKALGVPPPPVPPTGSNGSLRELVLMSTNAPELAPSTSVPPSGSPGAMPFLIPCDEKEEPRETKLELIPLSRLIEEKETHASTNGSSSQMNEKSKKVNDQVKSMLVSQLTSDTTTNVDDMVAFANYAFTTLNLFGADYGPLYKEVEDLINYKYDSLAADRKLDMLSDSELEKKYLDVVTNGNDIKDEKCLKDDEQKAQAEVEKLGTQLKEARVAETEIKQRKNEAVHRIESTIQRLMSYK